MSNQTPLQAVVIGQEAVTKNSTPVRLALFNEDGTPWNPLGNDALADSEPAAFQADTVAADLAALKVDFNALLDKLQTAGLMETS